MTQTRRGFLRTAALGAAASTFPAAYAGASARPNIVWIMADDLGYGDLSCLNESSKINTPNLDRMAGEGITFTDAHAPSAVCTPTRYGVMTGRYCFRSPLKNGVLGGGSSHLIAPDRMTVAALMKAHGYTTAGFGKWHLGLDWATTDGSEVGPDMSNVDFTKPFAHGPTALGFDYYYGISASLDMPPYTFLENDRAAVLPTGMSESKAFPVNWRRGPIAPGFKARRGFKPSHRKNDRLDRPVGARKVRQAFLFIRPADGSSHSGTSARPVQEPHRRGRLRGVCRGSGLDRQTDPRGGKARRRRPKHAGRHDER